TFFEEEEDIPTAAVLSDLDTASSVAIKEKGLKDSSAVVSKKSETKIVYKYLPVPKKMSDAEIAASNARLLKLTPAQIDSLAKTRGIEY
ncbi:MAG: hypothetical protein JXQ74_00430, partial [Alphaproteobacteria bacterium]|nr:hypothetical protein [Alphaproteobacteria bacterium]